MSSHVDLCRQYIYLVSLRSTPSSSIEFVLLVLDRKEQQPYQDP